MLSRLGRRHLLEQILASDEAYRSNESHQAHPHSIRAHRVVAVDDANVLAILVLDVAVGSDRAEHDERTDLKTQQATVTQHPRVTLDEKLSIFFAPQPPEKAISNVN